MKKVLLMVLAVFLATVSMWGQTADIDPAKLDLSQAEASFAGQDRIYVRSIYYGNKELAVILEYDGESGAIVRGPYYTEDAELPENEIELGYVKFEKRGTDSIVLSDVIVGNRAYSGVLQYVGAGKLELAYQPRAVQMPKTDDVRIAELKLMEKALSTKVDYQEMQLVAAKDELAEKAAALADLEKQETALEAKVASLEESLKAEKSRSSRLSSQVRSATAAPTATEPMKLSAVDPAKLDLSQAEFTLAGQDRIYVRSVYYAGQEVSVIMAYDGGLGATIYGPYYPADYAVPEADLELGYVKVQKRGTDSVVLSDVILGNRAYSGVLKYAGGGKLELAYQPRAVKMPKTDDVQMAELKLMEKALTTKVEYQEKQLAQKDATIADMESKVASLEQQVAAPAQQPAAAGPAVKTRKIPVVDPKLLDLSRAKATLAGPNRVYVRSIYYAGHETSVILEYSGGSEATIYGPYDPADQQLPEDALELGHVTFAKKGQDSIEISDIIIGTRAYAGVLKYAGGAKLMLSAPPKMVQMPETKEARIAELESKKYQLSRQVAELQREVVMAKAAAPAAAPVAAAKPATTVLSGFANGKSLYGNWQASGGVVTQRDAGNKFAKYSVPVTQKAVETVYRFTASSKKNDWLGFGLHFFASGGGTGRGYGYGRSYLVWLTRDPGYYKTERTYLQLYRSSDDVVMIQLASVSIPERIDTPVNVELVYSPERKVVEVMVNGSSRLTYQVESPILSGSSVVLRTLGGPVDFTNLAVMTR